MHNISPIDILAEGSQQSERNRMTKLLVAIADTENIYLHVRVILNIERLADTVGVSC
jgi:hypothetical protein